MVEEQVAEKVGEESVSEQKPEEIKENGSTEDEKPAENGDLVKDEKDGEDDHDGEDGDEDDGESSEEELGLLEKPVEILTSKRERKSIDVYGDKKPEEQKRKEELDYSKGKGVKLGDIPIVLHHINRADTEDLQVLHRMMYRRVGKQRTTKQNIRAFCGWPFEKDSKAYNSVKENIIDRLLLNALKWTLDLLAIEKSEDTEEMRDALCEFLLKPEMNDTEPKPRKSEGGSKRKSSGKKGTPKKKSTPKSKSKKKVADSNDDVSDVSEASDGNESDNEDEKEEEKPKKTPQSKKSAKKSKATPVKIAIPAKKKSASKKRKSESSEDEEPLAKKSNAPPTDAELKKVVSGILKDADLEQVTMKSVVKQVYDKYSSFDLSSRKDYIKSTVKELIS